MIEALVIGVPLLLLIVLAILVGLLSRDLDDTRADLDQLTNRVNRLQRRGVDELPTAPIRMGAPTSHRASKGPKP